MKPETANENEIHSIKLSEQGLENKINLYFKISISCYHYKRRLRSELKMWEAMLSHESARQSQDGKEGLLA